MSRITRTEDKSKENLYIVRIQANKGIIDLADTATQLTFHACEVPAVGGVE